MTRDQGNLMMSAASSAHSLIVCQGTLSAAVSCQSADQAAAARGPLCLWTSACDPQLGSALSALCKYLLSPRPLSSSSQRIIQ